MKISAVVITRNEENNIDRCLSSVSWVDEIVLIDHQSTDGTLEIANKHGARIYSPPWRGFGPAKQEGVERAEGEWILSIDADEEVSKDLSEEIQKVIKDPEGFDGFMLPRRTNFLGRWINHCGWYPDYVLRLFRRDKGKFNEAVVHEKVEVTGLVGKLKNDLKHYSYPDFETYLEKSNQYTTLGARQAFQRGRRSAWSDVSLRPLASFFSHYVVRQGFRDGTEGFIISTMSAVAVLVKYTKLRQMHKKTRLNE